MTREMTNKEAREVLQEQIDKYGQEYDEKGIEALNVAIKLLEQTRWIPANEKLPKSGKDVLATDGVDMFVAYVIEKTKGNYEWNSFDENYDKDSPIVVWMPLPKPYAESEGEE